MTYSKAKEKILDLFENNIEKYVLPDIYRLLSLSTEENENGKCAIPLALSIFSLSDLLGFLTDCKEIPVDNPDRPSILAFLGNDDFFEEMYKPYNISSKEGANLIKNIVRNKLVHRFFMPLVSISNDSRLPERIFSTIEGVLQLNVFYFANKVLSTLMEIKKKIAIDEFKLSFDNDTNDTILRMAKRLSIFENGSKQCEPSIKQLIQLPKIAISYDYFNQGSMFKP